MNNNARSKASPQGNGNHVLAAAPSARFKFPKCGCVRIVGHPNRQPLQLLGKFFSQRLVVKLQIIGVDDHAVMVVDHTWAPQTDILQFLQRNPCLCRCFLQGGRHVLYNRVTRTWQSGLPLCRSDDNKMFVHDSCYNVGPTKINSCVIFHTIASFLN